MSNDDLKRIANALERIAKALEKPSAKNLPAPYVGDTPPWPGQPYRQPGVPYWDQQIYSTGTSSNPNWAKPKPGEDSD